MRLWPALGALLALAAAAPAAAADEEDCANPARMASRACVFPEGQVVVESSLADWTRDTGGGIRSTSLLLGDTLVHVGVRHGLEAQVGIALFDRERTRLPGVGGRLASATVGDLTLGGKLAILSTEDGPLGIAIQPALTVALADRRVGDAGVGGSVALPISYDLSDRLTLDLTPGLDYTGDRARDGRHLEYGATLGLDWAWTDAVTTTVEYSAQRDRDPAFRRTRHLLGLSAGWTVMKRLDVNAGVTAGLTAASPRAELVLGFTRHFL